MKVIWTEGAADDLEGIVDRISRDSPDAASRIAKTIFDQAMGLAVMPFRGRKRSTDKSRELVFAPWPYLAVYEVIGESLFIKAIRHTSRNWEQ
ncbi:MAG: type II toxin-antitoxin system RelE/ParE family toxin [Acidobacteriaceae bacterium]